MENSLESEMRDKNGVQITPDLPELITKFLGLYFGSENVTIDNDAWKIIVDENEAKLTVDAVGKWVIYSDVECRRTC